MGGRRSSGRASKRRSGILGALQGEHKAANTRTHLGRRGRLVATRLPLQAKGVAAASLGDAHATGGRVLRLPGFGDAHTQAPGGCPLGRARRAERRVQRHAAAVGAPLRSQIPRRRPRSLRRKRCAAARRSATERAAD